MSRCFLFATFFVAAFACLLTIVTFNSNVTTAAPVQTAELPTLALSTSIRGFSSPIGIGHAGPTRYRGRY